MHMYQLWTRNIHVTWSVLNLQVPTLAVRFTADNPNNTFHPFRLISSKQKTSTSRGSKPVVSLSQYQTSQLLQAVELNPQLWHSELAQKIMYLAKHQGERVSCEQSVITV